MFFLFWEFLFVQPNSIQFCPSSHSFLKYFVSTKVMSTYFLTYPQQSPHLSPQELPRALMDEMALFTFNVAMTTKRSILRTLGVAPIIAFAPQYHNTEHCDPSVSGYLRSDDVSFSALFFPCSSSSSAKATSSGHLISLSLGT